MNKDEHIKMKIPTKKRKEIKRANRHKKIKNKNPNYVPIYPPRASV